MSQEKLFTLNRRSVLAGLAGTAGATLAACGDSSGMAAALSPTPPGTPAPAGGVDAAPQPPAGKTLPKPEDTGIDHIVMLMMENRTFDHMLGWVPGADGVQSGLKFKNIEGKTIETFRLSTDTAYGFQGCGWADPDHGYNGGRIHFAEGKLDGWLLTDDTKNNPEDKFPLGYYTGEDLPFFKGVSEQWTVCDRYFHGILASTFTNRIYQHAGQTDRSGNGMEQCTLPTIWDRLAAKGLSHTYFFQDLPVSALWYQKHLNISQPVTSFLAQAAAGQLPAVSFVEPRFLGENPQGVSNDDHPVADVRDGQAFMNQIYEALINSPQWERTLFIINYDEWGGFYDHVSPPKGPVSAAEAEFNDGRLGFRVPCLLMGPRAKKGVCHLQLDPNSILNFITWRFGLEPIGERANWSLNLAYALDFDSPARSDKPVFDVAPGPHGRPCATGTPLDGALGQLPLGVSSPQTLISRPSESHYAEWIALREVARRSGFKV